MLELFHAELCEDFSDRVALTSCIGGGVGSDRRSFVLKSLERPIMIDHSYTRVDRIDEHRWRVFGLVAEHRYLYSAATQNLFRGGCESDEMLPAAVIRIDNEISI
jgi:hypothetical protein